MLPRFSLTLNQTAVRPGGHVATHGRDHMAMWLPSSSSRFLRSLALRVAASKAWGTGRIVDLGARREGSGTGMF